MAEHPRFRSKYDPMGMVKPNETEVQFMLTDMLRARLFEAEQREAEGRLPCKVLHMGADLLRNGLSGIECSNRKLKWDVLEVRSADEFVRQCAQSELSVMGEDMICREDLPICSKGTGVVCTDQAGIRGHEYIISFLGVIYAPWTWYEKDDRGAEKQPELFTIMLGRLKDDARGYDVIGFVDPVRRGNYGSRLSHSRAPNAVSVSIAVYASCDIGYSEELCFHYNSITEDEQEWRDAVCLFGTAECNGKFLIYAGTQLYTEVIRERHHVLQRTAKLFHACTAAQSLRPRETVACQLPVNPTLNVSDTAFAHR